jgi:NADPH:quinone reductase-like Zn-dependent oxidoreductase
MTKPQRRRKRGFCRRCRKIAWPSQTAAERAEALGLDEVIDTSSECLTDGVRRITDGYGSDIVIDAIGGKILSEALGVLALGEASQP